MQGKMKKIPVTREAQEVKINSSSSANQASRNDDEERENVVLQGRVQALVQNSTRAPLRGRFDILGLAKSIKRMG
jgi:hypothetical protein